ncbi:MAG: hypothetical protein C0617_14215 [Desulfuromonas sp.]|uniref:hypothetical protein n=1 Tax=Desulfuromonas sp. TaxID=892 RepID=UPI000CA7F088|nr:hypothetical protein [Desulfuromonas sp.]PLX82281.1 MAG: hypothetical protein C0617_14215 [Desulfuromonas sp.]
MTLDTALIALGWGVLSGYLAIRTSDSLLAVGFCLHGLLMGRWKRLASKASTGLIRPEIILRLLFRVGLYAAVYGALLRFGYDYTRGELWFDYGGRGGALCLAVAIAVALSRLPSARRRLAVVWRMSHEFDYAEKRQRTLLLKV